MTIKSDTVIADISNLTIGGGIFLFLIYSTIISFAERETDAGFKFMILSIVLPLPFVVPLFIDNAIADYFQIGILIFVGLFLIALVIPFKITTKKSEPSDSMHDERDIMFARNKLQVGTKRFDEYYKSRPENLESDNKFRQLPGLLKKGSTKYDPFMFASAEATFFTVESLKTKVEGLPAKEKTQVESQWITKYLTEWSKYLGAHNVGFCELKDSHKYSHIGRGDKYGQPVVLDHKFAIAFTVEMGHYMTKTGPDAPVVMESSQQYLQAGIIAVQVAEFIRSLGYQARAHIDGNYRVICPLIAADAGLGEIGRMGLLITPDLGPRVRISVVTTDLPVIITDKKADKSIDDFCGICKKCADVCPSQAIPKGNKEMHDGTLRWKINSDACFRFWCIVGTDCGRCMAACPYSHPDNFMHNVVRFGIKHSWLFRRIALYLDDLIYGRKPKLFKPNNWMLSSKPKG